MTETQSNTKVTPIKMPIKMTDATLRCLRDQPEIATPAEVLMLVNDLLTVRAAIRDMVVRLAREGAM